MAARSSRGATADAATTLTKSANGIRVESRHSGPDTAAPTQRKSAGRYKPTERFPSGLVARSSPTALVPPRPDRSAREIADDVDDRVTGEGTFDRLSAFAAGHGAGA